MSEKFKAVVRAIAIVSGTVGFVGTTCIIYLTSPPGRQMLKQVVVDRLLSDFRIEATIRDLQTNIFNRADVHHVAGFLPSENGMSVEFAIGKTSLQYNVTDLVFHYPPRIEVVSMESLQVVVRKDAFGSKENAGISSLPLIVNKAAIKHISFRYEDPTVPYAISCLNLDIEAIRNHDGNGYDVRLGIDSILAEYHSMRYMSTSFDMRARVEDNFNLQVDSFRTQFEGLKLHGGFRFEEQTLAGNIIVVGNMAELFDIVGGNNPGELADDQIQAELDLVGENILSSPHFRWLLTVPHVRVVSVPARDVRFNGEWFADTIRITELDSRMCGGTMTATGWIALDSLLSHDLVLSGNDINIPELIEHVYNKDRIAVRPVSLNYQMKSSGTLKSLHNVIADGTVTMRADSVVLTSTSLRLSRSHLSATSRVGFIGIDSEVDLTERGLSGEVEFSVPSLAIVSSLMAVPRLEGTAEAYVTLAGSWESIFGSATITGRNIAYEDAHCVDSLSLLLHQIDSRVFIDTSFVTGSVDDLDMLAKVMDVSGLHGAVRYVASATGLLNNPHIILSAQVEDPAYESYSFDHAELNAALSDSVITLSLLDLRKDSANILMSGSADLVRRNARMQIAFKSDSLEEADLMTAGFSYNAPDDYSVSTESMRFQLANLNSIFPGMRFPTGGIVWNIDIRKSGPARAPQVSGNVRLYDGSILSADGEPIASNLHGEIMLMDSAVQIDSIMGLLGEVPFLISASVHVQDSTEASFLCDLSSGSAHLFHLNGLVQKGVVDGVVEGDNLDLQLVRPFFPPLHQLSGTASTRLTLRGPVGNLDLNGNLRVSDISCRLDFFQLSVTNGNMFARLHGKQLLLDTADFDLNTGHLSASGSMTYEGGQMRDLNMDLHGSNISISEPHNFSLQINRAELNCKLLDAGLRLSGAVEFGSTRFVRDVETSELAGMLISRTESLLRGSPSEPLDLSAFLTRDPIVTARIPKILQGAEFDLIVKNSDSLWINNNLARFRARADVSLSGSYDAPFVEGRVTVLDKGKLYFMDREFEITRGTVDFTDPERINPFIDLKAKSQIKGSSDENGQEVTYAVQLVTIGPLDDCDIEMTSDPPLEQSDIVSLLAFGVTYDQMLGSDDINAILKKRSGVLASGEISRKLSRWFGERMQVDYIGFEGSISDFDETRFKVANRWSDRFEVSYSTSLKKINEQRLSAKYRMTDYLYLEGNTEQHGESGADVVFQIKFR